MNKKTKTVSNAAKPKAETFEMWKERKLIEELKYMQIANEADKLKSTLKDKLSEGRRALNELAVQNWLKKKQESISGKSPTYNNNTISSPSIRHVQRKTVKPKVETRLYFPKLPVTSNIENQSSECKEEAQTVKSVKSKDENLLEPDQDLLMAEVMSQSNISNKSRRSGTLKSKTSFDHKQIKIQDDEISLNKKLCRELQKYLENPNAHELSERQTNNKISFEEWLKKKDAELREKKENEKRLQLLQEEERKKREEISSQAINEWYLKNAFRMVTKDKYLKNRKVKNKWALYEEMLKAQESESLSESFDL